MIIKFDPELTTIYHSFGCPNCGSRFWGGGKPVHQFTCSRKEEGYENLIVYVGRKVMMEAKRRGGPEGNRKSPILPVSWQQIKAALPQAAALIE